MPDATIRKTIYVSPEIHDKLARLAGYGHVTAAINEAILLWIALKEGKK